MAVRCSDGQGKIDMQADRWRRLRCLLDQAIDLDDAARQAYLDALREGDRDLRDDIERLLAAHRRMPLRAQPTALELVSASLAGEFDRAMGRSTPLLKNGETTDPQAPERIESPVDGALSVEHGCACSASQSSVAVPAG
jgi:hypothetical protein